MKDPAFDLVVVGAGGGPDETNLSAYLVKVHSSSWEEGIFALEAGSGQGALARLLRAHPDLFHRTEALDGVGRKDYTASEIYSYVRSFLVTHAHLDHINSLVVSAGSLRGARKRIYALPQTLKDLELVFSDRIWPNLASWTVEDEEYKLLYSPLIADEQYAPVHHGVSVQSIPLNHGKNALGLYSSTAFFVRHDQSQQEFLFFGDVEPDSLSEKPQTINVWRAAAPKIPDYLSCIFIECSWPSGRADDLLFGHLTPEHLATELATLAGEVVKHRRASERPGSKETRRRKRQRLNALSDDDLRGSLDGVRVYIMHCKDDFDRKDGRLARDVIVEQCQRVVRDRGLGAEVLAAVQGMHIEI